MKYSCDFEARLRRNLNEHHEILRELGFCLYRKYKEEPKIAASGFLKTVLLPWILLIEPSLLSPERETPNKGSAGGFATEKVFFNIISSMIEEENLSDKVKVENTYRYVHGLRKNDQKKRENSFINIDIGVQLIASGRILYCLEIKTNFKDNFKKFFDERKRIIENELQHNRPVFPYHYVCFSAREKKFSAECEELDKVKELWEFPKEWFLSDRYKKEYLSATNPPEELVLKAQDFLQSIYEPILLVK